MKGRKRRSMSRTRTTNIDTSRKSWRSDLVRLLFTTHGQTGSPEYISWMSMRQRCYYKKSGSYSRYGARGIRVCKRWLKFENFLSDMGKKPSPDHSLDRINNSKGYSPSNCKWATRLEQGSNCRNNKLLTFNRKTMCMAQWQRATGISRHAIYYRLKSGWDIERTLTTPSR